MARAVSNTGKVPKGSRHSTAKSFVTSDDETRLIRDVKKNGENCIRVNGGCTILLLLLDHFFGKVYDRMEKVYVSQVCWSEFCLLRYKKSTL